MGKSNKISWLLLRRLSEEIVKSHVDIHISTQMSNDVRGAIIKTQKGIEILLNAKWAKRAEDVYQTLAHELAHFKYPNIHSKEWDAEAKRILEYLKTKGGEQDEEE